MLAQSDWLLSHCQESKDHMITVKSVPHALRYPLATLAIVSLLFYIHFVISINAVEFTAFHDGVFRITDFIYHMSIVEGFWSGEIRSIYQPDAQRAVMTHLAGSNIEDVMPVGLTPTILVIWLPLSFVARVSMQLANTIWLAASLAVVLFSWWRAGAVLSKHRRELLPTFLAAVGVFFLSFTMLAGVFLAQTSLIAAGVLTLLALELVSAVDSGRPLHRVTVYALVFLLSIKTTYFFIAVLLLFVFGFWREALVSVLLVVLTAIALALWFGLDLITAFLEQLALYSSEKLPQNYASSIALETTNTLRSAYAQILGTRLLLVLSQFILAIGCGAVAFVRFGKRCFPSGLLRPVNRVTVPQLAVAVLAMFLLFLPYLGAYEELLLVVAFVITFAAGKSRFFAPGKMVLVLLGLAVILNHNFLPADKPLWLVWLIKAAILCYLAVATVQPQPGAARGSLRQSAVSSNTRLQRSFNSSS